MYKTVGIPFVVPRGKYCWKFSENSSICSFVNNEFNSNTFCEVTKHVLEESKVGILKCKKCLDSKDIKNGV